MADTRPHPAADLPKEINRNLGQAVRERRTDIDLTQGELAERIGMSRASVANIEAGEQAVSVVVLLALATALDLPAEALVAAARDGATCPGHRELSAEVAGQLAEDERRWLSGLLPARDTATA